MGFDVPKFEGSDRSSTLFAYLRSQGQRLAPRASFDLRETPPKAGASSPRRVASAATRSSGTAADRTGPEDGAARKRDAACRTNVESLVCDVGGDGSLGMAPPTFRQDELADVFAYLFVSRYAGKAADPNRGADLYRLKGCAACHGPAGEGGHRTVPSQDHRRRIERSRLPAPLEPRPEDAGQDGPPSAALAAIRSRRAGCSARPPGRGLEGPAGGGPCRARLAMTVPLRVRLARKGVRSMKSPWTRIAMALALLFVSAGVALSDSPRSWGRSSAGRAT